MTNGLKFMRGRRGVALLVVLGMLALLMISAVAFTILMRVERSASANLRHSTSARQMARGALAYAIAAIDDDVYDDLYPAWTNDTNKDFRQYDVTDGYDVRRTLRLPPEVFVSIDQGVRETEDVTYARVLSSDAVQYIPAAMRRHAEMTEDYSPAEWIPVRVPPYDLRGRVVGRYAYVILNTTGLLDANVVHSPTNERSLGATPGEIRIHPQSQLEILNAATFATQRDQHGHYETLQELATINSGIDGEITENFDVFSFTLPDRIPRDPPEGATARMRTAHNKLLAARGGQPGVRGGRKIYIGTEQAIRDNESLIKEAFRAAGLRDDIGLFQGFNQVNNAYLSLLDYVDEDDRPAGGNDRERFWRPASEAVPMFSQYTLHVRHITTPGADEMVHHRVEFILGCALYCPNGVSGNNYSVQGRLDTRAGDAGNPLQPPDSQALPNRTVNVKGDRPPIKLFDMVQYDFPPREFELPTGISPKLQFEMRVSLEVRSDNSLVDRADEIPLSIDIDLPAGIGQNDFDFWAEAVDPRVNAMGDPTDGDPVDFWMSSQELQEMAGELPAPYTPVFDDTFIGSFPTFMLSQPRVLSRRDRAQLLVDGVRDGDDTTIHVDPVIKQARGYVRNGPLQTIGELGYLPIGVWMTIHLYDPGHENYDYTRNSFFRDNALPPMGYHPVLDYFTLHEEETPIRGRVNLNTRNPYVLAAVFNEMPLLHEDDPGITDKPMIPAEAGNPNRMEDSLALAEWLMDKGPFTRLSDLGKIFRDTRQLGIASGRPGDAPSDEPAYLLARAVAKVTGGSAGQFGEFEREALVRNACGLLTTRGQTYTVIIRADAFSPRFGMTGVRQGNVLATAHAVAQIWRDTEPDADGNYPCFVHLFKFIGD